MSDRTSNIDIVRYKIGFESFHKIGQIKRNIGGEGYERLRANKRLEEAVFEITTGELKGYEKKANEFFSLVGKHKYSVQTDLMRFDEKSKKIIVVTLHHQKWKSPIVRVQFNERLVESPDYKGLLEISFNINTSAMFKIPFLVMHF